MPLPRPITVSKLKMTSILLVPARVTQRGAARSGAIVKLVGAACGASALSA
ncbi:hypothetical protein ACVWZR_004690 [Bradyrhizobium sp. i1.3.1]